MGQTLRRVPVGLGAAEARTVPAQRLSPRARRHCRCWVSRGWKGAWESLCGGKALRECRLSVGGRRRPRAKWRKVLGEGAEGRAVPGRLGSTAWAAGALGDAGLRRYPAALHLGLLPSRRTAPSAVLVRQSRGARPDLRVGVTLHQAGGSPLPEERLGACGGWCTPPITGPQTGPCGSVDLEGSRRLVFIPGILWRQRRVRCQRSPAQMRIWGPLGAVGRGWGWSGVQPEALGWKKTAGREGDGQRVCFAPETLPPLRPPCPVIQHSIGGPIPHLPLASG